MSLILCIETGTDICSVALAENGRLISLRESGEGRDHARKIGVYVDEMLRENGMGPDELSAVAIGKGPGSYTGLRIGVSFAKGLCYGAGVPLVAVDSLLSLASVAEEDYRAGILDVEHWGRARLCPMIDARRMEVYAEVFDSDLNPLCNVSAEVIDENSFVQFIESGSEFLIFGNGAAKCEPLLSHSGVRLLQVTPSARGLCAEAQRRFDAGLTEDVAYFEPFYLKDFVVTQSKKNLLRPTQ